MNATKLLYLDSDNSTQCTAHVVDIFPLEHGEYSLVLDQTVFYPQGGGQPSDVGVIRQVNGNALFTVNQVRFKDGIVYHNGLFEGAPFNKGENVFCEINVEKRDRHSRLHAVGHLIDKAVASLNLSWVPGKAFHFSEGPYVEYAGSFEEKDKELLCREIERVVNEQVAAGYDVVTRLVESHELAACCTFIPENIPTDKPLRVVFYGEKGVPCGGTHVRNTQDVGPVVIRKIRSKKGVIRVAYQVS